MNLPIIALVLLAPLTFCLHAAAVVPIHMDIEQHSSTKPAGVKSETVVIITKRGQSAQGQKTQHRSLTIKLSNNSSELIDGLMVKYFFLGHDMKDHKIKVLKAGERKAAIPPRGMETVESEEVAINFTEAHLRPSKGKGKGGKSSMKKIPASGEKIIGYAVKVMLGSNVAAESYSEPSYKKIVGAAPSISDAPPQAAKKKAPSNKKI